MNRTWTTLGLTAMLTVALAACRAGAQPGDPPKPDDPRQELEQLRSDTIHSFQAAQKDVAALREEVAHLRKDLEELRNARPPAVGVQGDPASGVEAAPGGASPAAQKEIDSLKEQVAQLRKTLDGLRGARPAESRTSNYGPPGDAAASGTGSIVLLNTYPADVTIVVDGEGYTLAPGERRVLAGRPAGAFTYEVVGVQPPVQRTLASGGAFPIHVHP